MRGRQGIPLPRGLDGPGRGCVEDPDCRTAAPRRLALARGRGRAQGGLQQSHAVALRGGEAGAAPTGGTGRALLCSHPGPGWSAPDVAAGPGECPQALSDPRRRHNLGLLMRLLIGAGTPKEAVASGWCILILLPTSDGAAFAAILIVLLAHSAIPALIILSMRLDRRPD